MGHTNIIYIYFEKCSSIKILIYDSLENNSMFLIGTNIKKLKLHFFITTFCFAFTTFTLKMIFNNHMVLKLIPYNIKHVFHTKYFLYEMKM